MTPRYPAFLRIHDRLCVVVGGGSVGTRKATSLLECGARVRVVGPRGTPELTAMSAASRLEWRARPFEPADLDGAFLAVAATDDPALNARVVELARAHRV